MSESKVARKKGKPDGSVVRHIPTLESAIAVINTVRSLPVTDGVVQVGNLLRHISDKRIEGVTYDITRNTLYWVRQADMAEILWIGRHKRWRFSDEILTAPIEALGQKLIDKANELYPKLSGQAAPSLPPKSVKQKKSKKSKEGSKPMSLKYGVPTKKLLGNFLTRLSHLPNENNIVKVGNLQKIMIVADENGPAISNWSHYQVMHWIGKDNLSWIESVPGGYKVDPRLISESYREEMIAKVIEHATIQCNLLNAQIAASKAPPAGEAAAPEPESDQQLLARVDAEIASIDQKQESNVDRVLELNKQIDKINEENAGLTDRKADLLNQRSALLELVEAEQRAAPARERLKSLLD